MPSKPNNLLLKFFQITAIKPATSLFAILALVVLSACGVPTAGPGPAERQPPPPYVPPNQPIIEIRADAFGLPVAQDELAKQYNKPSVLLVAGAGLSVEVTIPIESAFTFAFDVLTTPDTLTPPEGQIRVNGEFPLPDLQRVIFPIFYKDSTNTFPKDRYGNDALIQQARDLRWAKAAAWDANFGKPYPLQVKLPAGKHRIDMSLSEGAIYLGSIYLVPFAPYMDYSQYTAGQPEEPLSDVLLMLEAERPTYKNDTSVRPSSDRNLTVTPYDSYHLLLNIIGGESWRKSGSAVYYSFEAPADGLYTITLRAIQNTRSNFTVFRRITLNGEVPFAQLNAFPFAYSVDWQNIPLGDGQPFKIFLRSGLNTLGIEATNAPYLQAIETIQKALLDINALALEIRKLTGNQRDPFKEWVISNYIPDIRERLNAIAEDLARDKNILLAANPNGASPELLTYQMAIDNLKFLADDPDKIPNRMGRFSEGAGSAAQLLGSLLPLLQNQPLAVDKLFIHTPDIIPEMPSVPFTTAFGEGVKRFGSSFGASPYQSIGASAGELEVWVNRPRQYVDLLQLMADEAFTPRTGIRVKFSIMPDESKLVLANAANIQPDVALGVSVNVPYELAIRGTLYDLRSFGDFGSFARIYAPGALLGYVISDSVYAIPETQDFWVTFYRKDILASLGLPVPKTWDQVIQILPELQRFGMNYSSPLSSGTGQKGYLFTAPYLFNHGANLYSNDGFATGLQSEEAIAAIQFMADSFTIYGMPLTTASFFESFRYGTLPVGVSNFETYIKLMTAAPEMGGLWGIDLYPATTLVDGTQNRYATGSAQASVMFKNTDMPQQGWEFLKWWMSTETQVEFQERLVMNYGRDYLWSSANLEAFRRLDIPREHKDVILEQWRWLQEPVRLPGSYMQERELSNVWNRIVFDGVNPRVAIDRAVIIINREISRKMEEFGYLKDGQRVREFKIPTIARVMEWMK
jgi:ABC-type glycerol-3-phosphate transport system substrate-binding protein